VALQIPRFARDDNLGMVGFWRPWADSNLRCLAVVSVIALGFSPGSLLPKS
jgi:hypothetical protein